jgi:hypothetical protein
MSSVRDRIVGSAKEKAVTSVRERATRSGKPPRQAYQHYFIEDDGLHSRIHLQNFYSTFWPDVDAPATAHITVFDAAGSKLGASDRTIARFGCAFIEVRDLLAELGADASEGTVAIDLEPSAEVRGHFKDLPKPDVVAINTPFWMAYYDDGENYMYVHSIEKLSGEVFGTTSAVAWQIKRAAAGVERGTWRSWRLLESTGLTELQIVAVNHALEPGTSTVGIYTADDVPILEHTMDFAPRQLHRVRFAAADLRKALREFPPGTLLRIGLDPLLTGNGKPYVLMRYDQGPLSLHHG